MKDYILNCKHEKCRIKFKTDSPLVEYCSPECQKKQVALNTQRKLLKESIERYKDVPDIPTCQVCGFKAMNLIQHIYQIHGLTQKNYKRRFKAKAHDIYHQSYLDEVKTRGKGIIKECEYCGKEFEKVTPKRNYCSPECQDKKEKRERRKYVRKVKHGIIIPSQNSRERECLQCKKTYTPKKKAINSKFCCFKCRNRYYYEQKKKTGKVGKVRHCIGCGKEIENPSYPKYCSQKCKIKVRLNKKLKKAVARSKELYKDQPDIPECKACGFKGKILYTHIRKYHMPIKKYCEKYDVDSKTLIHGEIKERIRQKNKIIFDRKVKEYLKTHTMP